MPRKGCSCPRGFAGRWPTTSRRPWGCMCLRRSWCRSPRRTRQSPNCRFRPRRRLALTNWRGSNCRRCKSFARTNRWDSNCRLCTPSGTTRPHRNSYRPGRTGTPRWSWTRSKNCRFRPRRRRARTNWPGSNGPSCRSFAIPNRRDNNCRPCRLSARRLRKGCSCPRGFAGRWPTTSRRPWGCMCLQRSSCRSTRSTGQSTNCRCPPCRRSARMS